MHTLLEPGSGIYLMQNRHRIDGADRPPAFRPRLGACRRPQRGACAPPSSGRWPTGRCRSSARTPATSCCTTTGASLDAAEQALRIEAVLQEELDRGMDMARGPLFRVRLLRLADESFELVVSYHHTIMDAWCVFLLLSDFVVAYRALEGGREPRARPVPPYRDFIRWLMQRDAEATRAYWREALRGVEAATPLPADRPPSLRQGNSRIVDRQLTLTPGRGPGPAGAGRPAPAHRQHLRPGGLGAHAAPPWRRPRRAVRRHRGRAPAGAAGAAGHHRPLHQQHPVAGPGPGRRRGHHGAGMARGAPGAEPRHARVRAPAAGRHPQAAAACRKERPSSTACSCSRTRPST